MIACPHGLKACPVPITALGIRRPSDNAVYRTPHKWRPKFIPDSEIRDADLSIDDARLTIARHYDFLDWLSLAVYVEAISKPGPVFEFESAVEDGAWL